MKLIRTKVYAHTSKDLMVEHGAALGLKDEALQAFKYAGCEIELDLQVDKRTGDAEIVAVDGRKLAPKE